MNKKYIFILFLLIIILGFLFFIMQNKNNNQIIKIGYVGPLSGSASEFGKLEVDSIKLALEDINYTIDGKQVQLILEDSKCESKDAINAATKLINLNNVKMILGDVCSASTIAMASVTEKNNVLLLTGAASDPQISDIGEYIFRLTPKDDDFYVPVAEYYFNQGYRNISLIIANSEYCISAKEIFIKKFEELGGKVLTTEIITDKDIKTNILKIKQFNSEAILIIPQTGMTSGGIIAKNIKEIWPEITILGVYPMESENDIFLSKGALEDVIIYSMASTVKNGNYLIEKYKIKYNKEPVIPYGVLATYDRIMILKESIENCKEIDTLCMKEYITNTAFNLSLGEYSFDEKGDIDTFYTAVFKIKNNKAISIIDEIIIKK